MAGLGFKNRAAFERMVKGVRHAEGVMLAQEPGAPVIPPAAWIPAAHVVVTAEAVDGYYPAEFVYRNLLATTPADEWLSEDGDQECVALDINGMSLEVGRRYSCKVAGAFELVDILGEPTGEWYNGYALALVDVNAEADYYPPEEGTGECVIWYTMYLHLDAVTVHEGESLRPRQKIGTLGYYSTGAHLHFSLGDGAPLFAPNGNPIVGQTVNIDSWLGVPTVGSRVGAGVERAHHFSIDDLDFILSSFGFPLTTDLDWQNVLTSTFHDGWEYYSTDLSIVGSEAQDAAGQPVYAAFIGDDVLTVVRWVGYIRGIGWGVILKHGKRGCFEPGDAGDEVPGPTDDAEAGSCRGWGWVAGLRQENCLRAFVIDPVLLLACADCPAGAAWAYSFTLAGGTGESAAFNGDYTVTWSEGCEWATGTATNGATLVRSGTTWTLTVTKNVNTPEDPLFATVVYTGISLGCESEIVATFDSTTAMGTSPGAPTVTPTDSEAFLTSGDGNSWTGTDGDTITICGVVYTVEFIKGADDADPRLKLTTDGGSGGDIVYYGKRDCAACTYAVFAFPKELLCPDEAPAADACDDVVRIRVEQVLCGWFCVVDTEVEGATLADGPWVVIPVEAGDDTSALVIRSGPHATEAEAVENCAESVEPGSDCATAPTLQLDQWYSTPGPFLDEVHYYKYPPLTPGETYHVRFTGPISAAGMCHFFECSGPCVAVADQTVVTPGVVDACVEFVWDGVADVEGALLQLNIFAASNPLYVFKVSLGSCP